MTLDVESTTTLPCVQDSPPGLSQGNSASRKTLQTDLAGNTGFLAPSVKARKIVARIDPSSGQAIQRYPATGGGGGVTVGFGSLWLTNTGPGSVWREPIH
jgi:hypothetical protein